MIIETSCSHAPHSGGPWQPSPTPRDHIAMYEGKDTVVIFRTSGGTTFATSHYALMDSIVVINNVLRDSKYYRPTGARLYDHQASTPPPKDMIFPAEVPVDQIYAAEKWELRSAGADLAIGLLIVGGLIAAAYIFALSTLRIGAD